MSGSCPQACHSTCPQAEVCLRPQGASESRGVFQLPHVYPGRWWTAACVDSPVGLGNEEAAAHSVWRLLPLVLTSGPSLSGRLRSGALPASPSGALPSSRAPFFSCLPSELATILSPNVSATPDQKHVTPSHLVPNQVATSPAVVSPAPRPGGAQPWGDTVVAVRGLLSWLGPQAVSQSSWPQWPSPREGGARLIFRRLPCV